MLNVLASGTLVRDPVERTSATGKPCATALVRMPCDGEEALLCSVIAFRPAAVQGLLAPTIGGRRIGHRQCKALELVEGRRGQALGERGSRPGSRALPGRQAAQGLAPGRGASGGMSAGQLARSVCAI